MEGFFFFLLKWLKVGNYDFRMKMERVLWIWFYHIRVIFAKYFSIILINLRFAKRVNMPEITVQWKYWLRIREPGKIPIGGSTSVIYTSGKLFHSTPPPPKKNHGSRSIQLLFIFAMFNKQNIVYKHRHLTLFVFLVMKKIILT